MSAVLVLGPSRWEGSEHSAVPSWITRRASGDASSPLGARRGIATFLRDVGVDALVIEDWPEKRAERQSVRFLRLVREAQVGSFLVY